MAVLGGADELVVRQVEPLHHRLEARHVALDQFARREILLAGGLLHLDAVFVGAGEEEHVVAIEPHEAGDRVGGDRLVGVADVRHAVGIGDRRRDVVARLAGGPGGRFRRGRARADRRSGFRSRRLRCGRLCSRLQSSRLDRCRLRGGRLRGGRLRGDRLRCRCLRRPLGGSRRFRRRTGCFRWGFCHAWPSGCARLGRRLFLRSCCRLGLATGRGGARRGCFHLFWGWLGFSALPGARLGALGLRFGFFCHGGRQQSIRSGGQIRRWPGQARP